MTTPWPPRLRPLPPSAAALSLLFVDISLRGSAKAEKCKQSLKSRVMRMTMATVIEPRAGMQARLKTSRIAAVGILSNMREAETVWRGLQQSSQFSTPYQRFDLLEAWQRQVGDREGVQPFIVIGYDKDRQPLLLLPLGIKRESGVRVARFLGGKHATFNMALWRKDFAVAATHADLDALMSGIRADAQADVLALTQQ